MLKAIPKIFLFLSFFMLFTSSIFAQKIKFEGVYGGKKMMIYNPLASDYIGTCIQRITVNGEVYPVNISTNYIELDFTRLGTQKGDFFNLIIDHKQDCKPFIYNPQDFKSSERKNIKTIYYKNGTIHWETVDEIVASDFVIEFQFRGNWYFLDRVESKGAGNQSYNYWIPCGISGENKVRISKTNVANTDFTYVTWENPSFDYQIHSTSVTTKIHVIKGDKNAPIPFYQLVDQHGVTVKTGYDDVINVSYLNSGFYTLYLDNKKISWVKK